MPMGTSVYYKGTRQLGSQEGNPRWSGAAKGTQYQDSTLNKEEQVFGSRIPKININPEF